MDVGLRIDVDTYSGTRYGLPCLLKTLDRHGLRATFFVSLGPDNMGRHAYRLLRPGFRAKLLRSNAASLYGWDTLLRGTFWPGPVIGERLAAVIRETVAAGHEVGLHAWDHHRWQTRVYSMSDEEIYAELRHGVQIFEKIVGAPPACSAAPGWRCSERVLAQKEKFGFKYNSDCRGTEIFTPVVDDIRCAPQIPVTLPTYDEVIGRDGITDENYNDYLLGQILADRLNVLTVHAEVEGRSKQHLFREFLDLAGSRNIRFVPLSHLLNDAEKIWPDRIVQGVVPGRDDQVCWQASALNG